MTDLAGLENAINRTATMPRALPSAVRDMGEHTRWVRENVTLHAVVRLDPFLTEADAAEQAKAVTVVALLPTRKEAEELTRLMQLRDDDNLSYYFCTPASYYPGGGGLRP